MSNSMQEQGSQHERNWTSSLLVAIISYAIIYVYRLNQKLSRPAPPEFARIEPWKPEDVKRTYDKVEKNPTDVRKFLPGRTGRRYIVTGGSGLVGSWMVIHLLLRGEDPEAIRILDLQEPVRPEIVGRKVSFVKTDVTDQKAVTTAFEVAWPKSVAKKPLTVFHTAALIKGWERHPDLQGPHMKVNVQGTQNVVNAAKAVGCDVFVTTSSGSVEIRKAKYFPLPWLKYPKNFYQRFKHASTADSLLKRPQEEFWGHYPYSKALGEGIVRRAHGEKFRTGAIRPSHAIYGHGVKNWSSQTYGLLAAGGYPIWLQGFIMQFVDAQNVSIGHLAYERTLLRDPSMGGRAYFITDASPPMTYGDLYNALIWRVKSPMKIPRPPVLLMVVLAYLTEVYITLQRRYLGFLPPIVGDPERLQPSILRVCTLHTTWDDSDAQKELGYKAAWGTMEGVCQDVCYWNRSLERKDETAPKVAALDPAIPAILGG